MATKKKGKKKPTRAESLVIEYKDIFDKAYRDSLPYLETMDELQMIYDSQIDGSSWPTQTQMPIPYLFNMVEKALPGAIDYLFPRTQFIQLTPKTAKIEIEKVVDMEEALQVVVIDEMKLQKNSYATLKDCFKLGIGFGIIETILVTPFEGRTKSVRNKEGKKEVTGRVMQQGKPIRTVRYRYVSPGQVITTMDGTDFNGNDKVSTTFFIDDYSESDIEDMYKDLPTDGENPKLKSTADHIIKEARDSGFDSRVDVTDMIAALGGHQLQKTDRSNENIKVRVPIVKIYESHRHIWIANFKTIIYEESDTYQTMRNPMMKASAWPDGSRFYPTTPTTAGKAVSTGMNIFVDALFDLVSYYWKPPMVYDKTKFPDGAPQRGPGSDIGSVGSTRESLEYLKSPDIPATMFTVGDKLAKAWGEINNQPEFLNAAEPGIMRGGGFAFGDLTKNITLREILAGAILETGWLESVVIQTMINLQLGLANGTKTVRIREFDSEAQKDTIRDITMTEDDFIHAFDLSLTLDQKNSNSVIGSQNRMAEYDRMKDNRNYDQYQVERDFIGDEKRAKRILLPKETIQKNAEEARVAELQKQAGAAGAPTSTAQQATAGAEAAQPQT